MAVGPLFTEGLELMPLPPDAAAALPEHRGVAEGLIGARLSADWPQPDLLRVLPRQVTVDPDQVGYGIWLMIEPDLQLVVGDVGFHGPPVDRVLELGYSVVPDRRRRGYASQAARALVAWALRQPEVSSVVAGCDMTNDASIATLQSIGFSRTGEVVEQEIRWRL
jgi:ribosomal-protein-alanine N-acetyltransferase